MSRDRGRLAARAERRATGLMRCYPRAWRERYGEEFIALLIDDYAERPFSPGRSADVVRHGLGARLREAGLAGEGAAAERRLRVSLGVVWCALGAFLAIGVAIWSQLTVSWQWADPRTASTVAGMWLMSGALLALASLLLLAAAPVLLALARALGGGRWRELVVPLIVVIWGGVVLALGSQHFGGPWPGTGGHWWSARGLVPAPIARVLWAATSWFSSYWLHPGWLTSFPTNQIAWMALSPCALAATLTAVAIVVRRLRLAPRVLRLEAWIAALGTLAMIVFLAGAASWVLGSRAPDLFNLYEVGAIDYVAVALLALALVAACAAARRAVLAVRAP